MVDLALPAPDTDPRDPWAWAHEDAVEDTRELHSQQVVAVLVTRNGAEWLPGALAAIDAQTLYPARIIAVDNGSVDGSADLLESARAAGRIDLIIQGDARWSYGQAVDAAMSALGTRRFEWLWLCHDDAEPAPDALMQLVRLGVDGHAGVVVPKLLHARRRGTKQIAEMGSTVSFSGARVLQHDSGDVDQGQSDIAAVLGGSTCGMLIATEAWERLGGFDPAIPFFRDGVEFGWRANLVGISVLTAPHAEIVHREVGRAGLREGVTHPTATDRAYGMVAAAAHRRGIGAGLSSLAMVLFVWLGALGLLLGKAPSRAANNMRAARIFMRSSRAMHNLRRRVGKLNASKSGQGRASALRPGAAAFFPMAAGALASAAGERWYDTFGSGRDGNLDDLIGDDFAGETYTGKQRRPWLAPTAIMWSIVLLLSVLAARHLYGPGHLISTNLMPAPDTLTELYHQWVGPIPGQPTDVGPAWLGWILIGSVLTFGQPEWFVTVLVVLIVPISMVLNYQFLRSITVDRRAQLLGSLLGATAPVLVGATTRGALGTLMLALLLPMIGMSVQLWRHRGTSGFESWRGPFLCALLLTVWFSFQPLAWGVALLIAVVGVAASRRIAHVFRALVVLVVPLLLHGNWLPTLLHHPGRILTGEDPTLLGTAPITAHWLLLGRTPGAGLPATWVSIAVVGGLWLIALLGIALRPGATRLAATAAIGSLLIAVVLSRLLVPIAGADQVRPTVLPWLLIMIDALICTVAVGFNRLAGQLSRESFGIRQALAMVVVLVGAVVTIISVGSWVGGGLAAPLQRDVRPLPSYVTAAMNEPTLGRVLEIEPGTEPRFLLREAGTTNVGGPERGGAAGGNASAHRTARQLTADLVVGRNDGVVAARLVELGVVYVVMHNPTPDQAAAIGAVPGLQLSSNDGSSRIWRVTQVKGLAQVGRGADAALVYYGGSNKVPNGAGDRRLIIAQPRDYRWLVTREGAPLSKAAGDWRATYTYGELGGKTGYTLRPGPTWWGIVQLVLLLSLLVASTPSLRSGASENTGRHAVARRAMEGD